MLFGHSLVVIIIIIKLQKQLFFSWMPVTVIPIQEVFFWMTFDRKKIESCGFHRSKEEIKVHRTVNYKLSQHVV